MNEPIKVLQVFHGMDCGGAENMIMNLYRNIDRTKIQFDFLVHTDKKCFFDKEIQNFGGRIFHVPYYNIKNHLAYQKALQHFFKEHPEIKIVHGHLGSCAHIYLKIAKEYGCFTIAHSHSTKPVKITLKSTLYRLFTFKTRKIADYFMSCSIAAGKYRYGNKIMSSDRHCILNNAIDTNKYVYNPETRNKIRDDFHFNDEFVLGHIGRFDSAKNQLFVVDIFYAILKKNPNAKLLLVGDGEWYSKIEMKVKELGICDKVILTGVRSDVPDLLQAMDCFVFPSLYEGLGIVAVEAQAAGLFTVCSDVVPNEASVTDLMKKLSLSDAPDKWADFILNHAYTYQRKDMSDEIRKAGYDIHQTAKWLEKFYLKIAKMR